jgi:N-acetylneuraminic acid mutarotase
MKRRRGISRHRVGLILALVGLLSATTLALEPLMVASVQAAAGSWSYTGDLNTSRYLHTATLLPDGTVLVAGGSNATGVLDSAELYDPDTGMWSITGSLNVARSVHTATVLQDGKVLVAGGITGSVSGEFASNTAELYDPASRTWSLTGNLNVGRDWHTATLLHNGKVLVAGGASGMNNPITNTAELYDPATGIWSTARALNMTRFLHTATLLQNGKVLIAGGCSDGDCEFAPNSAELYDPNLADWSPADSPKVGRESHTATLLPNGKVLVAGGALEGIDDLDTTELYNPAKGRWSLTGSLAPIYNHTATLLANGKVLVAGGFRLFVPRSDNTRDNADIYDPATGNWKRTARLNGPRLHHTATLLSNGKVLVVGGNDSRFNNSFLRSAELYDPEPPIPAPRISGASVTGKKLIVGGENFDDGAVIVLNGEEQKTANDGQNPKTTLIGKKAGKKIKAGDKLQVRNPDGTLSEEFIFTGS